jgi:hypothetical protein
MQLNNDTNLPVQAESLSQPIRTIVFKLKDVRYNIPPEQLLDDLKEVAGKLGRNTLTLQQYGEMGKFNPKTFHKRFGSWNKALQQAGLEPGLEKNIPEKELFENMEEVWISLGRQPMPHEMRRPLSRYSSHPYLNRFGNWRNALSAFIEFINGGKAKAIENLPGIKKEDEIVFKHKTKRYPGERLKVQVLMRDGNKCRLCGATITGDNIHFDHIIPWSKGGETVLENLQVLCKRHNLAKGDLS